MSKDNIRNREYMSQVVNYSGMSFGNIRPMDIDGFIEYHDKAYIFYEVKFGAGQMSYGQELALVRLVDNLEKVRPALLVLCSHNTPLGKDIALHELMVTKYRRSGKWRIPRKPTTVYEITEDFLDWVDERNND